MAEWMPALGGGPGQGTKQKRLTDRIIGDVERGALAVGARLPPHRALAHRLGVSVQTVSASYKEAERRGYLRSEVGRGTFVRSRVTERVDRFMLDRNPSDLVDFSIVRAAYTERHEAAARALLRAMAEDENGAWMRPCRPVAGLDRHRAAALGWLARLGVPADADRVLITNGAAQAVFVALATIVRAGDVVLTEQLTDHGVIGLASMLGFTLRGLPTDGEGILPDAFAAACAAFPVKALFCIPTFGNPSRYLAGAERRAEIARIAERHGVHVVEDEVFKPLLVETLPAIAAMIPDLGFFATSFTKSVLTGLRTGYLVVPPRYALRAASILRVTSWSGAPVVAEMASRWVESGEAEALVAVQRAEMAARQAIVAEVLGEAVVHAHPHALSAWIAVPDHWTEEALVRTLFGRGVAVSPSDPFVADPARREGGIRICLGGQMPEGRLRAALETVRQTLAQLAPLDDAGLVA
jgi:DNA-binding transcriptional MocR family regulator